MSNEEALKLLTESQAMLEGHFLLSSGLHSDRYFQCARLFVDPRIGSRMVELLLPNLPRRAFDCIVGPAMGGIIVAYELARQLETRNVFAERENNVMTLRRGFQVPVGAEVLICEDVVTTGKSSAEVAEVLRAQGVKVAGVACLVDRSGGKGEAALGVPLYSVVQVEVPTWKPDECPLCQSGFPVVKPGSRNVA